MREHVGTSLGSENVHARQREATPERTRRGNDREQIRELARGQQEDVPRSVQRCAETQRRTTRAPTEKRLGEMQNERIERSEQRQLTGWRVASQLDDCRTSSQ